MAVLEISQENHENVVREYRVMSGESKISIIIPIYNTAEYLPRCLDSILHNTYRNLEIICVNDGSTDDSAVILEQYAAADSRIIMVNKENAGVSAARNTGLDMATGDFIAFVDSDDWIHYQYFEILLSIALENNANVVVCNENRVSEKQKDVPIDFESIQLQNMPLFQAVNDRNAKRYIWGRLYSKDIVKGHLFASNMSLSEDAVFNLDVLCGESDLRLFKTDVALYYYFSRSDSAVHTISSRATEPVVRWYLSRIRDAETENIKSIYLFEAFKSAFSYRYGTMYELDRDVLQLRARDMISECLSNLKLIGNINHIMKAQYYLLSYFPFLYRAFRIKDDKTLLKWERVQKQKLKDYI